MNRKFFVDAGKRGAAKRWASRHEMLVEISKIVDKKTLDKMMKYKTEQLKVFLNYTRK
jgi:hypothetical protein